MDELIEFDLLGNKLTVIIRPDGSPLFVAADICNILILTNVTMAMAGVDDDDKLTSEILRAGQKRMVNLVTESGMYSLILRSNKEEAKTFKKWITSEVLPSIRKTGSYQMSNRTGAPMPSYMIEDPIKRAEKWIEEQKERKALESAKIEAEQIIEASLEIINEMQPKVEYAEKVLLSESDLTTTSIASELGMSAIALNKKLASLGVQRRHDKKWILYGKHQGKGYTTTRTYPFVDSEGKQKTEVHTVWTEKGREFIHKLIGNGK